jgi:Na+/proline symporter
MNPLNLAQVPIPEPSPEYMSAVAVAIAIFLIISTGIGFYMMRKAKSFDEWMVGHRDIGPLVTGFALVASWLSGWAIYGNAGYGYAFGWSAWAFIGTHNIFGIALCIVLGYRMRRYAALGARTVPEVIGLRFESKVAQSVAGVAMLLLLIVYSVGQFKAMATVWSATTGTPWLGSVLVTAILVFVYMAVGGYAGTHYALAFQGFLLTVVSWCLGIAAVAIIGPDAITSKLATEKAIIISAGRVITTPLTLGGNLMPLSPTVPFYDWLGATGAIFMFLFMATGFPHNISRFLGVRKVEKRELWLMALIIVIGSTSPLWIGLIGCAARVLWGAQLIDLKYAPMFQDAAAIKFAMYLGPGAAAFLAAGVFAAAVSTLAAMVMIMATNITRDLIHIYKPQIPPQKMLWATRALLLPIILIPFYWTVTSPPPILVELMAASAVCQAGIFFTTVAVSMYWKRATKWGVIVATIYGMIIGTLFHPANVVKWVPMDIVTAWGLNHWGKWALTTIGGCLILYFLVSLATKPLPPEKLERFFPSRAPPAPAAPTAPTAQPAPKSA